MIVTLDDIERVVQNVLTGNKDVYKRQLHTEGGIAGAIFVLIVAFILKYFRSKKTKA